MIAIAGYGDFVKGFKMLGIQNVNVIRHGEEKKVESLLESEMQLIILDGRVFEKLTPYVKDKMITSKKPLFFIIHPHKEEDESLKLMIKRALGVEIESLG